MDEKRTRLQIQGLSPEIEEFFQVRDAIGRLFDIDSFNISGETIRFGFKKMNSDFKTVRTTFRELGYHAYIRKYGQRNICMLVRMKSRKNGAHKKEIYKAWALFIVTFITTTIAGLYYSEYLFQYGISINPWLCAFCFSGGILLILGSHEMGHKWAAMRNGIEATPPYFIPFPTLIGTMGAVIRIKSPTPDNNAAIQLGVSGPIIGFLFTIPFLIAGVLLSSSVPASQVEALIKSGNDYFVFGEPLLLYFAKILLVKVPDNHIMFMHPLGFAAWVGMLVTFLNLIPMAQLDGGHILHALAGHELHRKISWFLTGLLFAVGVVAFLGMFELLGPANNFVSQHIWPGWMIWGIFGFVINRRGYPKTMNDSAPLDPSARIIGVVALIIFILCFMPNPIIIIGG